MLFKRHLQAKPMPKPRNTSRKKTETPPKQPPSPEVTEDFKDDDVSETLSGLYIFLLKTSVQFKSSYLSPRYVECNKITHV